VSHRPPKPPPRIANSPHRSIDATGAACICLESDTSAIAPSPAIRAWRVPTVSDSWNWSAGKPKRPASYFSSWLPNAPRWPDSWPVSRMNNGKSRPADIVLPLNEAIEEFANATVPAPVSGERCLFTFTGRNRLPNSHQNCVARVVMDPGEGHGRHHWDGSVYRLHDNEIFIHWDNPRFYDD
jgi:hypothetical protein